MIDLTPEEAMVAFALAVGELQAIKAEEIMGEPVNTSEVNLLYSLANKQNPDPANTPVPPWNDLPPLQDDDAGPHTIDVH